MAAMTEAIGDDKLDTVGPTKVQQRSCSAAESFGEVGDEPQPVTSFHIHLTTSKERGL
jgi:hypothetical protein